MKWRKWSLRPTLQVQDVRAHEGGAVVGNRLDRRFEPRRLGGEAGNDRGHEHAGVDAGVAAARERREAAASGARCRAPARPRRPRAPSARSHTPCIPQRRPSSASRSASRTTIGPLRDDADRRARREERFERSTRELVVALDRLVGIGGGSDGDRVTRPGRLVELPAEYLDQIHLHEDQRRELVVRAELELRLITASEAVVAAVRAAAVRVQRPVERHALHRVQRRAAGDFLIARRVGAALRLVERGGAAASSPSSAIVLVVGGAADCRKDEGNPLIRRFSPVCCARRPMSTRG